MDLPSLYHPHSLRSGIGAIPYIGGTTFRVWAPNATSVNVAGCFNGWSTTSKPLGSEANGWWSRDVSGAGIGDHYKYVMPGNHWRTDPRARDVVSSVGNGIIVDNRYTPWGDNGIGGVNLEDFAIFAAQWQNGCDDWDSCQGADFNMSGVVDMTDLAALISRWLDGVQ